MKRFNKLFFILMCCVSTMSLTSCLNDDDNGIDPETYAKYLQQMSGTYYGSETYQNRIYFYNDTITGSNNSNKIDSISSNVVISISARDSSFLISGVPSRVLAKEIEDLSDDDKEFILKVYERVSNFLEIALGCGMDSIFEFNLKRFCSTFNYTATPVLNALKILSISGYIEFIEETDSLSRVMILVRKEELYELHETDPATDRVLQCLLRSYTGLFADYIYIHEDLLAQRLDIDQHAVYEALLKLNRLHVLHYVPRRRTPYIVYTRERMEPRYVHITREAYEERRKRMADRIESMITYATSTRCRQQMLLEYFGEKGDYECGCCDNCIERRKHEPPSIQRPAQIARAIQQVIGTGTVSRNRIVDSLPYPEDEVIEALRFLRDEGFVVCEDEIHYKNKE